ncbi:gag [Paramuricea clavata]|uniref:TPA_exp: gag n=1 Tax=Paramuricea clavata TaxID=317549 RepID=A0A7D9DT24_PARCT|nr:gag [Paramuricea clavata]
MPPIRNHEYSLSHLRKKCAEKGLSTTGRKATLVSRIQQYASSRPSTTSQPSDTATPSASTSETSTPVPTGERVHTPSLVNDAQMTQVRSIVSRSVEELITEIASQAAHAAENALQCSATSPNESSPATLEDRIAGHHAISSTRSPDPVPATVPTVVIPDFPPHVPENESFVPTQKPYYGHLALDLPAAYVKQTQTGEFFDLEKLLPREFPSTTDDDSVVLTLENSIITAKKANQQTQKITNIEQWTTAFTVYMGILTSKFPSQIQELLQYMSLIRYASQTHRGFGWCIYDHKFRRKAALNASLNWSQINHQLCKILPSQGPLEEEIPAMNIIKEVSVKTPVVPTVTNSTDAQTGKTSINNAISKEDFSLQYVTIDHAIKGDFLVIDSKSELFSPESPCQQSLAAMLLTFNNVNIPIAPNKTQGPLQEMQKPKSMTILIKDPKTDHFRLGQIITIGATSLPLCPVVAMKRYLTSRKSLNDPLFVHASGKPLTKQALITETRSLLTKSGLNAAHFGPSDVEKAGRNDIQN